MSASHTYGLNPVGWKKILLLRAGAVVADVGGSLFLAIVGLVLAQLANLADGTGRYVLPATVMLFVSLRSLGFSLGNSTVGLLVVGSTIPKNFLRLLALLAPGYNLFDLVYALRNPNHQTFTDMKVGVRVVVDTLK